MNQLGKLNELIIKPDPSELTEEKDVVEETVEEESGSKADCVFTATSLETALNLVITLLTRPSAGGDLRCVDDEHSYLFTKCLISVLAVSSETDK